MRRTLPLNKRGFNFETIMWLFTRLSALGMYAFILMGAIGALIMGARTQMNLADLMRWSFMPNTTHVQNTNVLYLSMWSSPFWKVSGSLLYLLAMAHGVHGVVVVCDDYIVGATGRKIVRFLSVVVMVLMGPIGLMVIWAY